MPTECVNLSVPRKGERLQTMNRSRDNKIIGFFNIIFGIAICINWFLLSTNYNIEEITYWNLTNHQEFLCNISWLLNFIVIFITFLINFIYLFKNRKNKGTLIANAFAVLSIIMAIGLRIGFMEEVYFYINSIVIISGMFIVVFNKNKENENQNKSKLLLITMIIMTILLFSSVMISIIVRKDFKDYYSNNERNLYKNIKKTIGTTIEEKYIPVEKNGKWGYIDKNGDVKIDFMYDTVDEFIEIEDEGIKYYIAPVVKGNTFYIITKENKIIESHKNENADTNNSVGNSGDVCWKLKDDAEKVNQDIEILYCETEREYYNISQQEYRYICLGIESYDENNSNLIHFSENISYDKDTKILKYKGKKIDLNENIGFNYEEDESYTYLNGYIPCYNFEENIHGWVNLNGEVTLVNGRIQILDFLDDYILLRDYSNVEDITVYFIDYQGNIVSPKFKEISILSDGYIVKKDNGKNVYIDKNFNEKTKEYDIIDGSRIEDGIIIVSNLPDKIEFKDDKAININFDIINLENGEYKEINCQTIRGMDLHKYNAKLFYVMDDDEYRKYICNVNNHFVNDELYQQYYE